MDISNLSNMINTEYENLSNAFKTSWELRSLSNKNVTILDISTSFPSQYDGYFKPSYHVNGNFYIRAEWDGFENYKCFAIFTVGTKENVYQTYREYVRCYHDKFQNEKGEPFFNVHPWDKFLSGTFQLGGTLYFYTKDLMYTDGDFCEF